MREQYIIRLTKLYLSKLNYDKVKLIKIFNKIFDSNQLSNQELVKILKPIFINRKPEQKFDNTRVNDRINNIIEFIPNKITSVLDIGAGDAEISLAVKQYYNLSSDNVMVLDPKVKIDPRYTKIEYDQNYKIMLPNQSVDLILIFNVFHHVNPYDRINLINEAKRVLKQNGLLIIREHDAVNNKDFITYLDLVHSFWYIYNNEEVDPMWLFNKESLNDYLSNSGWLQINYKYEENLMRLFYICYRKI